MIMLLMQKKYVSLHYNIIKMKSSEFASKLRSWYLWGNLIAMIVVVALIGVGVKYGLDVYTHHGEAITIPDLKNKSYSDAQQILMNLGLNIEVSDTGYIKNMPADCILEQTPQAGARVKSGNIVRVIINAPNSPTITLPDIIDNSSLREATAKLTSMGFKMGAPRYVAGEKDWVYGVLVHGKRVSTGDKISIEDAVVIQVGSGIRDESDTIATVDAPIIYGEGGSDEFEEVTGSDDFAPVGDE